MEQLQLSNKDKQPIKYELISLKQEITEGGDVFSIEKIQQLVAEFHGNFDLLVDQIYNMVCDNKDFTVTLLNYQKQLSYPQLSQRHRELFYYFFDKGYVFLGGDGHESELISYQKKSINYTKHKFLSHLFGNNIGSIGNYYMIKSLRRTEYGITIGDVPIINQYTVDIAYKKLGQHSPYTQGSVLLNEVTHALIYQHLTFDGVGPLSIERGEYITDVVSEQVNIHHFMENITYALIPEMHGKSVMDPFLLEHYATSYQQHMVIRESILRKYGIYDAFFKEYTNGFQQLVVTNNPKHLTYYDYSSSMIQKYYNFIVNHKLEIQEMLLKDAKTIIEKYKSLR